MISIVYPQEVREAFDFAGVSLGRIGQTVNDRHRGYLIGGNPIRLGAIHWFDDEILFVMGTVTKSRQEGNRLKLDEVTVSLPLQLAARLPAGNIERRMDFPQILRVVAESFGLPVGCSKHQKPALFHIDSDWDGETHIEAPPGDTFLLQGTFSPENKKCSFVWVFSLNKYKEWYHSNSVTEMARDNTTPIIEITPAFKGYMIPADLLQSEGGLHFWVDRNTFENGGLVFRAVGDNFIFSLEFKDSSIVCTRNATASILTTDDLPELKQYLFIGISWTLSTICLYFFSGDNHKNAEVPTIPVAPPSSMIRWARQQNLVPTAEHESEEALRAKVCSCLSSIQNKIDEYGVNPFWDIQYSANTIVSRTPKREPDIHPMLNCILSDQMLQSSIEVIPEYHTGVGNLDFAFLGTVRRLGPRVICAEFKNAHASDILKGLKTQLPQYMRNKNAQYGAYCVLFFKGDWFAKPEGSIQDLDNKLHAIAVESRDPMLYDNTRVFIFNLSKPTSASVD
jgi:hypothetical protein